MIQLILAKIKTNKVYRIRYTLPRPTALLSSNTRHNMDQTLKMYPYPINCDKKQICLFW